MDLGKEPGRRQDSSSLSPVYGLLGEAPDLQWLPAEEHRVYERMTELFTGYQERTARLSKRASQQNSRPAEARPAGNRKRRR